MSADSTVDQLDDFVSLERGEIDRRIFADEELFERELDLIFGRAWNFLCHESQIPKAGDFFETPIGRDNVLTVRQRDGGIKALLNTCAHRGNAVCRAEEGNTKAFMCTYHGWTYDLAGNLVGVPNIDSYYKGELDKSKHGMRKVAQLDSYHGFVFATMDPTAPPLTEFLGAAGRMSIDLIAARNVEVLPGIQKFVIDCNWKFAVDNTFDFYHAQITHMSAMSIISGTQDGASDSGGATDSAGQDLNVPAAGSSGLEEIAVIAEYGHAIAGPTASAIASPFVDESWRERPEVQELLGPVGVRVGGHPNIFPNAWISTSGPQVSLRIPISPNKTEVWWFTFADKDATPEQRAKSLWFTNHGFGPAGLFEQEDGENWAQSTLQVHGPGSQQVPQLLSMDLARGKVIKEHDLARIEGTSNEHAQLWLYHSWVQWMKGLGWAALREATTPPDVL
ncbi:aromatic ring-hydroxylating oxygenase subunit alpha [Amycolatopsis jejuensis]|uniref:aromatic ring-hydroxylating oxygenase subunit alpha n=1 Tax=Amycolatopsis jejuensis TaxID=330084 RepID=UPI000689B6B8|nr:aromatic ring-hydroxylating dioxygenase subunit alpha [Amycolatopsis jejuensis]